MKFLIPIFLISILFANDKVYKEQDWGIGAVLRTASIPYKTDTKYVNNFIPMLFFENKYIFLNGLESGIKLYDSENYRISAITRMRFVDIPKESQNQIQADTNDVGLQFQYKIDKNQKIDFEIMDDLHGRNLYNLRYNYHNTKGSLDYKLYGQAQYNSSKFNSYYYGLNQENISSGTDIIIGAEAKYHIVSNLYLLAKAQSTYLNKNAQNSTYIEDKTNNELYLGIGFFNEKKKKHYKKLGISQYIRIAHGWATPSNLGDIIGGDTEKDPFDNQMTSIFYGYPLTDRLFSLPIDIYLTPGFVYHYSSKVQDSSQEYVLAIKAYYTFKLPWKIRFGFAEGISYASDITYIEKVDIEEKGYKTSNLLNYLDFSLDISLGDIFGKNLKGYWLGYSIHHRSAIFESSSRFGRIKGGSNYNSVYIQYHF